MTRRLDSLWVRQVAAIFLIGVLVGLIGPFGTFEAMPAAPRVGYWLSVVAISWFQWVALDWLAGKTLRRIWNADPVPWWVLGAGVSLANAALLTVELQALHPLIGLNWGQDFAAFFTWVAAISLLIYAIIAGAIAWAQVAARDFRDVSTESDQASGPARFLRRLPREKRGALFCIKTEDHYLRVVTDAGEDLILLRFKDALRELENCGGMQVHRSYWVALDAIQAVEKQGRKHRLRLKNGLQVPVSRTFLPKLKAAGWMT